MGTVIENVTTIIPSSKFRAQGTLLITHWGVSGPAILKLSSYAARFLNEQAYQSPLSINWANKNDAETMNDIVRLASDNSHKIITNTHLENISQRLWNYLIEKAIDKKCRLRWTDLSQKDINRIVNTLCNDNYHINGRSTYKEEFVTCGGISLSSINPTTLESRCIPNLFFAGEILDIDGITGGFNFQAAWTTAYTVAQAITNKGRHH
jgi:predicted Rossmann fold flavoprotein